MNQDLKEKKKASVDDRLIRLELENRDLKNENRDMREQFQKELKEMNRVKAAAQFKLLLKKKANIFFK